MMLSGFLKPWLAQWTGRHDDQSTREFIKRCHRKWPPVVSGYNSPAILVGQTPWRPSICANAFLANYLATKHKAAIHGGFFGRHKCYNLDRVYESFGCSYFLNWLSSSKFATKAHELFLGIQQSLRTKEDIFSICVCGVPIGDLIYDTYLRYYLLATVDLVDTRLHSIIRNGVQAALACDEYFGSHKVKAYLAYDAPYIESGIIHRFAVLKGVPVYCALTPRFGVIRMDGQINGNPNDFRNWPSKTHSNLHDRRKFRSMTSLEQMRARDLARKKLEVRLNGAEDRSLLPAGNSAYASSGTKKLLRETGRPRILVLLHDFCDAPNVLRWSIFPDFWEWLHFLLRHAINTPFDWYVKPHPHRHQDDDKARANAEIIAEFKKCYPEVMFLDSQVSNKQLINEGIAAMFTVHGTAAHEFAYLGVPVVNAGYNHHINYSFNIHSTTKEEYAEFIHRAGSLELQIDKSEVEEFVYTHFIDLQLESEAWIIPLKYHTDSQLCKLQATSQVYREFIAIDTEERDHLIKLYLDNYFNKQYISKSSS
jgi:hypothetical protein